MQKAVQRGVAALISTLCCCAHALIVRLIAQSDIMKAGSKLIEVEEKLRKAQETAAGAEAHYAAAQAELEASAQNDSSCKLSLSMVCAAPVQRAGHQCSM